MSTSTLESVPSLPQTGNSQDTRILKYSEALNEALREEMRRDPTVFLMGEGIAERGGIWKVTENLMQEFGAKRVRDTPIAEASFTGAGVGLPSPACGRWSKSCLWTSPCWRWIPL